MLPLYVAASISGEYIYGLELAEAFGISEEAHQMVALDLQQNPMQALCPEFSARTPLGGEFLQNFQKLAEC